jgi:hypothetical protein
MFDAVFERTGRLRRRIGALCAAALAVGAISAVSAGAAQAEPLELEFNYGNIVLNGVDNLGVTGPAGAPTHLNLRFADGGEALGLQGDIEAGAITIPAANFSWPVATPSLGDISIVVDMSANNAITGTFASGVLSLDFDLVATFTLSGAVLDGAVTLNDVECTVDPLQFTLTSDAVGAAEVTNPVGEPPYSGDDFAAGVAGPGSGGAGWDSLPAVAHTGGTTDPPGVEAVVCGVVGEIIGAPEDNPGTEGGGGIWMGQNVPAPQEGVPLELVLDHGVLDVGALTGNVILEPDDPATLSGTITGDGDSSAGFEVPSEGFVFPESAGTVSGFPVAIGLTANQPITGDFDALSGAMSNLADLTARVTIGAPLNQVCDLAPGELTLSTSETTPYLGVPFDGLGGDGAVVASWATLPPATPVGGGDCALLDSLVQGPGGIWLSHGIEAPGTGPGPGPGTTPRAANLRISVKPRRRVARVGRRPRFVVTVRNAGGRPATGVRVCARKAKALRGKPCRRIGRLNANGAARRVFRFKPRPAAAGRRFRIRFTARANALAARRAVARLRVRR